MDRDPRAGSIGAWSLALVFLLGGAAGLLRASRGAVGRVHLGLSGLAVLIGILLVFLALRRSRTSGSR